MMVSIFDVLNEFYTIQDLRKMFQKRLFEMYDIIVGENDITEYNEENTYNKDDCIFTYRLGVYQVYVSLIDNNNEPLNNSNAWESVNSTIFTSTEFEALKTLMRNIIPYSIKWYKVNSENQAEVNGLKYIIGLFFSCYLANQNGALSSAGGNGGVVSSKSIDSLQVSYAIPDFTLKSSNLFLTRNPFGLEIMSLRDKLFIVPKILSKNKPTIIKPFKYNGYGIE